MATANPPNDAVNYRPAALAGAGFATQRSNPLHSLANFSVLGLLFLLYSRVTDGSLAFLHLPGIFVAVVIALCFMRGAFVTAFSTKVGRFLLAFTLWLIVAIPFSVWRGGSTDLVIENWPKALLVFIAVGGLVCTFEQTRQAMQTIALATGVLAILSLFLGDSSQGRLAVIQGKFANPNDLAQALLIGLPFWWFMARDPRKGLRFALAVAFLGAILVVLAKTGSRGGLVAFLVMLLLAFWKASARGRLALILGCAVLGVLGVALAPRALTERYTSIAASDDIEMPATPEEQALLAGALNSSAIRRVIFEESVRLTLMHPLFGVGPGMFTVASADEAKKQGARGKWLETHNTYTQISSEAGLPALIFYLSALFGCLLQTNSLYKLFRTSQDPRHAEIAAAVLSIQASLVAFGVTALFSSVAYVSLFPTLAGLSVAVALSVRKEAELLRATPTRVPVLKPQERPAFQTVPALPEAQPLRPTAIPAVRARLGGRPRPASLR